MCHLDEIEDSKGLTSDLLGDINTNPSGLAMRNMKDSTLNWEPRLITEKKSIPNTRANSLDKKLSLSKEVRTWVARTQSWLPLQPSPTPRVTYRFDS